MKKIFVAGLIVILSAVAFPQTRPQKPDDDQPIRISTELIQIDVVVTDKKGRVVPGLTKADFELFEEGKKQTISFFDYYDAGKNSIKTGVTPPTLTDSGQGLTASDVKRIFAFVVDDLTIRIDDLVYIRQMLTNFVDNQMLSTDLVAIIRTVGGRGLLQQFTTDKALLKRAIESLTPRNHPLSTFNNAPSGRIAGRPQAIGDVSGTDVGETDVLGAIDITTGQPIDPVSPTEDTNKTLRSYMGLGTASFVIDSMKQLPGRKSLVLVSSGLPIFSSQQGTDAGNVSYFLNLLADQATRAGVAIHTMDIRGMEAHRPVATFDETPGKSMVGGSSSGGSTSFGRVADESLLGRNPVEAQQGLRVLASATGGLAILNKNDFDEGLGKIVEANDGYYLLAYTPSDPKFDNKFRKVEVKAKGDGLKVYSRRGYIAREDRPAATPTTPREQLLVAIKSPLAQRDISFDAMLLYKAALPNQGALDIYLSIDASKLKFDLVEGKQQAKYDIAGFVFDEFGRLRGGTSETVTVSLTPEELNRGGAVSLPYTATDIKLPPGNYQVRLAVRDNKTNSLGTISRYLEVPDLSKGRFYASSLLLGAVPPGDASANSSVPLPGNRRIARKSDLRYALFVYNPKVKDGKPQVKTQLSISQNGQVIFTEPEQVLAPSGNPASGMLKWGQLGLSSAKPGRYTLTLTVTDMLADKKSQTLVRSMDFVVVN